MAEVYCPNMLMIEFNRFRSLYEPAAKQVAVMSYSISKSSKSGLTETKEIGRDNLYFNKSGVLMHSTHLKHAAHSKTFYGYSESGQLLSMLTLERFTNRLIETRQFIYDKGWLLKEELLSDFSFDCQEPLTAHSVIEREGNVIRLSHRNLDNEEYTIIAHLDEHHRMVEEKCFRVSENEEEEVVFWLRQQWDGTGKLIGEQLLEENGEVGEYNQMSVWASEFVYNDRQHWIKEDRLRGGALRFSMERQIDYY